MLAILLVFLFFPALSIQFLKENFKHLENVANEDFQIVYPILKDKSGNHQFERDLEDQVKVQYTFNAFNKEITLNLEKSSDLVSDDILFQAHDEDGTISKLVVNNIKHCFFSGKISSDDRSTVSVSVCDGLYGFINTQENKYVIEPFPDHLRKRDLEHENGIPHIIYKNNEERKMGCGVDHHDRTSSRMFNNSAIRSSKRAAAGANLLTIETAIFADYYMFSYIQQRYPSDTDQRLFKHLLTFVNGIQLLYNLPSLGQVPIKYVVMRIDVFRVDKHPWALSDYGFPMMENFCKYQASINIQNDVDPRHYDHGMLLSGVDMRYPDGSYNLIGVAPIGGLCTAQRSCSISEGMNFMDMFILAHELGHNFGMEHDGDGNNCNGKNFFMAPYTEPHHVEWSTCSRNYIATFLTYGYTDCLLDDRRPENNLNHEGLLPGQKYNLEEQCQLFGGIHSVPDPKQQLSEICYVFKCLAGLFPMDAHSAIEGTYCGQGRWCRNKNCVPWGNMAPQVVNGGWGPWTPVSQCQSGCMQNGVGMQVSMRLCNNPSPQNGGRPCPGEKYKFQLCSDNQLCRSRGTFDSVIGSTCANKPDYMQVQTTGRGEQRLNDASGGCTIWCDTTRNNYWISWNAAFPTGTYCGNGNNQAYCFEGKCINFQCSNPNNCVGTSGPLYG